MQFDVEVQVGVGVLGTAVGLVQHDLEPGQVAGLSQAFRQTIFGMGGMRKIVAAETSGEEVAGDLSTVRWIDGHMQPPARGRSGLTIGDVVLNPRPCDSTDLVDIGIECAAVRQSLLGERERDLKERRGTILRDRFPKRAARLRAVDCSQQLLQT